MRKTHVLVSIIHTYRIYNVKLTSRRVSNKYPRELNIRNVISYKDACVFLMLLSGMAWKILMYNIVQLTSQR